MPNLAASAAVLDDRGVLLIQRRDFETWVLPGGRVEANETLAQAAARETLEETGIEVELTRLVGVYCAPRWHHGGDHVIVFAGRPVGGTLRAQESEAVDIGFWPVDGLPSPLAWWHEDRIHDAVSGIGGSVARLQDMVWPFAPGTDRRDLGRHLERSGLTRGQFYERHFGRRGPEDGRLEVSEVRRS